MDSNEIGIVSGKQLISLNQLAFGSHIFIYGTGTFAISFYTMVKFYRPDINVDAFINSFYSGECLGLPVIKYDSSTYLKIDKKTTVICVDKLLWHEIVSTLDKDSVNYLVNYFWDFDMYGKKTPDKIKQYVSLESDVRNIFSDSGSKLIWDALIKAFENKNIESLMKYEDDESDGYLKYNTLNFGDIVIDGGSSDGTEVANFSKLVGKNGKIFAFDIRNENISQLSKGDIEELNIFYIPFALWSSDTEVSFGNSGTHTMILGDEISDSSSKIKAASIDSFVKRNDLSRVDLIKLDVEGAELQVLKGAINTIEQYLPMLVISIYHKLEDYFDIPLFMHKNFPAYEYRLGIFNAFAIGTLLYCIPKKS